MFQIVQPIRKQLWVHSNIPHPNSSRETSMARAQLIKRIHGHGFISSGHKVAYGGLAEATVTADKIRICDSPFLQEGFEACSQLV